MIQSGNQEKRHTLPRWNSIRNAEKLGEVASAKEKNDKIHFSDGSVLKRLLFEWKAEKNLPLAIEIVSLAKITESSEEISEVIQYAQTAVEGATPEIPLLKELLFGVDSVCTNQSSVVQIERLKRALIQYPRNPLLWSELSREYTILGQEKQSKRAIHVAHNLAPDNRTVLRAIARFYTHVGDLEQGLFYLRKSPLITTDPWVTSSEIALSNELGKTSKNVKLGQRMLTDNSFHPRALSELASELGTMDFVAGSGKQGKRKLLIATRDPHENAIAQIAWINKYAYNVESIIHEIPETHCNFEAETRWYFDAHEWEKALKLSALWQEYQPFSREPAMVGSFIATDFLSEYEKAKKLVECGLTSNMLDYQLLNNYAYVLALSGQLDKAKEVLIRAERYSPADYIPLIATKGLLCYRQGDMKQGKSLYTNAIGAAKKANKDDLFYRATLCLAREEKRCGSDISKILASIDEPKYALLRKQYEGIRCNFGLDEITT